MSAVETTTAEGKFYRIEQADWRSKLSNLLAEYYHDIFSLEDDERGETDLVEFKIDTGVACQKGKQLEEFHLQLDRR